MIKKVLGSIFLGFAVIALCGGALSSGLVMLVVAGSIYTV